MRNKNKTRMLVTLGLLTAVQIVLSRFCSFSAWNVKIGFGFLPIAVAGILFGPLSAAAVGAVSDFLGAVLFPIGPYFPGFTLTAALTGAVYGLVLHRRQGALRILAATLLCQLGLSLLLNTLWISVLYGSAYTALLPVRLTQCAILGPVEFLTLAAVTGPIKSIEKRLTA